MVEQEGHCSLDGRFLYEVIIVEHEGKVVGFIRRCIDESRQNRIGLRRACPEEQSQGAFHDTWPDRLPGRQQVTQEALQIVVFFSDRKPGNWEAT